MSVNEVKKCRTKGHMLEDGCWEYQVGAFFNERQTAYWAQEFVQKLKDRRAEWGDSIQDREL